MNPSWPNFLVLQRPHFSQAALVAWSAAEVSGQKGLDQFPGERRPDHFPTQTKDIHVVIFDALMGMENTRAIYSSAGGRQACKKTTTCGRNIL